MKTLIHDHERVDDLHRDGLRIIQDPERFCFGVDAVLLTGFCRIKPGETVLDLGTGTGIIPILLSAKTKAKHFTGLEIQKESCDMATRSILLNGLQERIRIDHGDIKQATELYKLSGFDVITTNPPYMSGGSGIVNANDPKAVARHEILCSLRDVLSGAARLLRPGGRFYMVHRPSRLSDIISSMRELGMEPKRLRFVHPYIHKEPILVLIEAVRGGKAFMTVMPPLIIYDSAGVTTKEVYDIYYN